MSPLSRACSATQKEKLCFARSEGSPDRHWVTELACPVAIQRDLQFLAERAVLLREILPNARFEYCTDFAQGLRSQWPNFNSGLLDQMIVPPRRATRYQARSAWC